MKYLNNDMMGTAQWWQSRMVCPMAHVGSHSGLSRGKAEMISASLWYRCLFPCLVQIPTVHTVDVTYNLSFFFWRNLDPWHIFPVILEKPSVYMLPVRNLNHLMLVWWELLSEDSPEWCAPWQGFEVGCRELLANQGILTSGDVILELGSLQDVSGKFHLPSGIWKQYCEVTTECSISSGVLMWKVGKPSLKKSCDKRGIDCASTVHSYSWN